MQHPSLSICKYRQNLPHLPTTPRVLSLNHPPHLSLLACVMVGESRNPEMKRCHRSGPVTGSHTSQHCLYKYLKSVLKSRVLVAHTGSPLHRGFRTSCWSPPGLILLFSRQHQTSAKEAFLSAFSYRPQSDVQCDMLTSSSLSTAEKACKKIIPLGIKQGVATSLYNTAIRWVGKSHKARD